MRARPPVRSRFQSLKSDPKKLLKWARVLEIERALSLAWRGERPDRLIADEIAAAQVARILDGRPRDGARKDRPT